MPMKFLFTRDIAHWVGMVVFGVIAGFGLQFAHAWVAPTQTPPNGNVGLKQYVSDCGLFAANGWASKDECLHDGRWHKVLSHGTGGAKPNQDVLDAISNAADFKVVTTGPAKLPNGTSFSAPPGQSRCVNILTDANGYVVCLDATRYSGNIADTSLKQGNAYAGAGGANKGYGASIKKSNGLITCIGVSQMTLNGGTSYTGISGSGCGPYITAAMDWYVKY